MKLRPHFLFLFHLSIILSVGSINVIVKVFLLFTIIILLSNDNFFNILYICSMLFFRCGGIETYINVLVIFLVLVDILLDWISFDNKFIWSQIANDGLGVSAVAQFSIVLLIRIFFGLMFFLAVNVKVLLCEPLINFYRHVGGSFFGSLIYHWGVSRNLPIIAHFSMKLPWDTLFFLDFLHARFHLNALIYIFNLLEDFSWNLISAIYLFETLDVCRDYNNYISTYFWLILCQHLHLECGKAWLAAFYWWF